jgi:rod shape determining protein RodA
MIAVGSGGLFGKGFGNATQAAGGFLPEAHTDFVFALLAEEFGFVGACLLLGLFALLVFGALGVGRRCDGMFGKLVCVGVVATWTFQIFENVGMCLSLMPITGIPLPFVSFGSSSMIVQLLTVGIVQSLAVHATRSPAGR